MRKKNEFSRFDRIETVLQHGTSLNGNLKFEKPLKIKGDFNGEIESDAVLFIDSDAAVKADINARVVIVSGRVDGNITASERIELLAGARVRGDLKSFRIKIADEVVFEGRCKMIHDPETIDIFSASVDKLKEIARSV